MDTLRNRPELGLIGGIILGLVLGLLIGWVIWPVEWTDASPAQLAEADQEAYARMVAELFSFDGDTEKVRRALTSWNGDVAACRAASKSTDPADQARLEAVAAVVNGQGCAAVANGTAPGETAPAEEESGGSSLGPIFFLGILLIFLIAAIYLVMNRRRAMLETDNAVDITETMPQAPAAFEVVDEGQTITTPLAQFTTTYTYGNDAYDDSFSIENVQGDFLGECGVGISESIGTDLPKNVTALEIWLFDKNDIRTVTKVLMSDHAFFDDALKAKLAPKGEPILARENETIVLETATLIINAEIKEMQYGTGTLPPQSFFERITIELSAWSKESGAVEADASASDALDY